MDKLMTSLICATLGPAVFSCVMELRGSTQAPAILEVAAQCQNKCQGDFPDSSKRKYAQALDMQRLA